jgi:hypothetical protein
MMPTIVPTNQQHHHRKPERFDSTGRPTMRKAHRDLGTLCTAGGIAGGTKLATLPPPQGRPEAVAPLARSGPPAGNEGASLGRGWWAAGRGWYRGAMRIAAHRLGWWRL